MLVVTRQEDESLVLDFSSISEADLEQLRKEPIKIVVVEVHGSKVRLGTQAPRCVAVHREEVYKAIQRGEQRKHV